MTWPEVTVPTAETLAWAARSVSPRARVRWAGPFSDRSAPWRVDLAGTKAPTVVLRAGDPTDHVAKQRIAAEVAALRAVAGVPAARLIASDVTGGEASQLAIVSTFLEGSSDVPRTVDDEHCARWAV